MILDVDMGNTRIKWLLSHNDHIVQRGAFFPEEQISFFEMLSSRGYRIDRVRVASVRPTLHKGFDHCCQRYWRLTPQYAVVARQFASVVNAYKDIGQMGVDRWLGIVAASKLCGSACIVVSAGSAITVDLLSEDQRHLGGFIAPGLQLMRESLYRDTDQVKLGHIDYDAGLKPGCSTQEAVSSGLLLMQLGLLKQSVQMLAQPTLFITGGDGVQLQQMFLQSDEADWVRELILEPDLVFKGLSLVL